MKRIGLIRKLEPAGCLLIRHGGRHDWYQNPKTRASQPIPRHDFDRRRKYLSANKRGGGASRIRSGARPVGAYPHPALPAILT